MSKSQEITALEQAEILQGEAASYGFEWPHIQGAFDKIDEELNELKHAYQTGDMHHVEEELGDLLFVIVNLGRYCGLRSENVLKQACQKFQSRIDGMHHDAQHHQIDLRTATLDVLETLWQKQKEKEQQKKETR